MSDEPLHHFDPPPPVQASGLKSFLSSLPPRVAYIPAADDHQSTEDHIATAAAQAALLRSEARRDAILAVALAIKRRGQNPAVDWTTQDADTVYSIADQLMALGPI